jgi:hypothetical protein
MTAVGGEATYSLQNPAKGMNPKSIKAGWLTEHLLMLPNASAAAQPVSDSKPFPFTLGFCGPDPKDKTKPLSQYFVFSDDLSALASAETIIIRFVPNEVGSFVRYLELQWNKPDDAKVTIKRFKVTGNASVPDYASDSRYKLWAYTGYTYLRSKNNFKDSFAELLTRFETRWLDERIAMMKHHPNSYAAAVRSGRRCDGIRTRDSRYVNKLRKRVQVLSERAEKSKDPDDIQDLAAANEQLASAEDQDCPTAKFSIVRIYGEAGLTGTAAVATASPDTPNQTTIGGITRAFSGSAGFGIGKTVLVSSVRSTDTSAFSAMGVLRLGMITVPGATDSQGNPLKDDKGNPLPDSSFSAFSYTLSFRLENEPSLDDKLKAGNFEGAYAEIGFGESEQFSRKKYPRLRFDGLLPIPSGSDLFRFALRLQIDAARPFAKGKSDQPSNLANEIRISALFNMDLLQLGRRIAGNK